MKLLSNLFFLLIILTLGCDSAPADEPDSLILLEELDDGQARVQILIDEAPFYSDASLFYGSVSFSHGTMALNLKDQFNGQLILSLQLPQDLHERPWKVPLVELGDRGGSMLVGKIVDKLANKGLGYIMTTGTVSVSRFDKDAFLMDIDGLVGKYGEEGPSANKVPITGSITFKNPSVALDDLTWKDIVP